MEPSTRSRRQLAIDYVLLNDGYEGEEPMENVSLTSGLQSPIESSFELGPEDSISQIVDRPLSRNLTEEAQGISPVITDDVISSQPTRGTANHWLWEQFEPTRSKMLGNDQLITCKHCRNWSIKDSARSTSTTNMSYHELVGIGDYEDTHITGRSIREGIGHVISVVIGAEGLLALSSI
ncbi:hypothetical protein POJ06DRAFT_257307 [Lipomyces tetrasporus]|uniref:BED-type domain-containing protein n=1 Tax=Lipomyces tetrasporus TaxID=54092 RepID=A0AAD7QNW1_9ASCO|nr:uncharacterized protein POJ06DRAFT_257307 [Lipomyces tetrasporus]KAJ8098538.1 hypothetical protein POJ06DRAFT_257307 [Lipomyces tetrasporus]